MEFTIDAISKDCNARAGTIKTFHGDILTPIFMPVGTVGSVKAVHARELKEDINNITEDVKEGAHEASKKVESTVKDATTKAEEKAQEVKKEISKTSKSAKDNFDNLENSIKEAEQKKEISTESRSHKGKFDNLNSGN